MAITRKNTLLLFSKVPKAGLVKTRLTTLKDGIFTPETASVLYHCMLFDVAEICCNALKKLNEKSKVPKDNFETKGIDKNKNKNKDQDQDQDQDKGLNFDLENHNITKNDDQEIIDTYNLVISTTPKENLRAMQDLFEDLHAWPIPIQFIADTGTSFDEHYNDAFDQVWESGADTIVSCGADMPALTEMDIIRAFDTLHELDSGIVIAPDQELGVSLVGWKRNTKFDHSGVYYNKQGITVLPAYISKARESNLPVRYLPPIPDVDTMADFYHMITIVEALNYSAPFDNNTPPYRTAKAISEMGYSQVRIMPNGLIDPRDEIDNAND